jgi:crotonobetainyl-CoA:carnitine CoA-transferase CaiB-like acyl-CoA transferase
MAPHGVYRAAGEDNWVAIACRDDRDWRSLTDILDAEWTGEPRWSSCAGRLEGEAELDRRLGEWTGRFDRFTLAGELRAAGVPAAAVQRPAERIDDDPETARWGLWPTVKHSEMGDVRVDGIPVHFSETDWVIERGAPCLGEHNDVVFGDLLGHSMEELEAFRAAGAL